MDSPRTVVRSVPGLNWETNIESIKTSADEIIFRKSSRSFVLDIEDVIYSAGAAFHKATAIRCTRRGSIFINQAPDYFATSSFRR